MMIMKNKNNILLKYIFYNNIIFYEYKEIFNKKNYNHKKKIFQKY